LFLRPPRSAWREIESVFADADEYDDEYDD
jgi:hypothetical protein